jgi:hypothetical protein
VKHEYDLIDYLNYLALALFVAGPLVMMFVSFYVVLTQSGAE